MKFITSIRLNVRKGLMMFILGIATISAAHSQTITINSQLFVGGTYRDSSNITVPVDLNTVGTDGFGYGYGSLVFTNNYFKLALIPVANAAVNPVDTSDASIINMGGKVIGKFTFNNYQASYTTFVNGIIPKLGVGTNTASYVLRVISTNPFIVSNPSAQITVQRTSPQAPHIKSFAIAGTTGNTSAINYDPTHSAMFFGYCGAIVDSKGNPVDTSISLIDSTAGSFNTAASYDSVILIKNTYSGLINTDNIVYTAQVTPKGIINFPSGSLKAGNYYTLLLKAKDDSGYVSSKSYYILNSFWTLNLSKKSSPNGCKGDTISLYPEISNTQAGQQFGIINNFPGLLYNINWGDPKIPGAINYTYAQLLDDSGIISHVYDTSSCPSPSHYWTITAKLANPFTGNNCSYSVATPQVQIWSSVKSKYIHHQPVCIYDALDTAMITFKDSSYGGTNATCTGTAYYIWSKAFVGCGNINNAVFTDVDSSTTTVNGNIIPSYVAHYDHKDTFNSPGKYFIQLVANNSTCLTNGYIDSIIVVAPPHVNYLFDSLGVQTKTVTGCAPLTVAVNNLSDSTCSQKWSFKWDVTDLLGNIVPPGSAYTFATGSLNTDLSPKVIFNKQGTFKLRLIGSNACTKADTATNIVIVNGIGAVVFPTGNQPTSATGVKTNAFCIYNAAGKTVSFDSTIRVPVSDMVLKPSYSGTPGATNAYTWTITDIRGTHAFNGGTTTSSPVPNVTFNTPPNADGDFIVKVTYSSNCGISSDSFELFLNRQVVPAIISPAHDTSVCANTTSLQFTGTVTAANGTNSGYNSVVWTDSVSSSPSVFGNGLSATLNFISGLSVIKFQAFKPQPNGCPDTFAIRKVALLTQVGGRDTAFSICSGTQLNYNPGSTSTPANNTYIWTSSVSACCGPVTGNTSCGGPCTKITDILIGNGTQGEVDYVVTPISSYGCPGIPFTIRVTVLPYPTISISAPTDTICTGSPTNISVNTNTPGATYCWVATLGSSTTLTPYNQSSWPTACNLTPTSNGGGTFNIEYSNSGNNLDTVNLMFTVSVAGGTCSSPPAYITMSVVPGPTVPVVRDTILCNASSLVLNANAPSAIKNETGTWSQPNLPAGVIVPINSPTATISGLAGGNVYTLDWTITSPLAQANGCQSLTNSMKIYDRPVVTTANVGADTTICNYTGINWNYIHLKGNTDPTRPYETGEWTVYSYPPKAVAGTTYFFQNGFNNPRKDSSLVPKDVFQFNGPSGTYTLIYTIKNDGNCTVSTDTFRIGAGFANDSILTKDTAFCKNTCLPTIIGSTPTGGGGNYTYQWYLISPVGSSPTTIVGANSQNYTPPTGVCPITTTQYIRYTSSAACLNANLPSNIMTINVNQPPAAGLISTLDTSCKGFVISNNILRLDTINYPVDSSDVYSWYVNGVHSNTGTTFSTQGLYTINNPGDSAVVVLLDSSKYGCGIATVTHTFYTRIKPNPLFTASTWSSCNTTNIVFTDTTLNPGLYSGWHWDLGEGDTANTFNPPTSYKYIALSGRDSLYTVCLSAWTACHDTVKNCQTVKILAKPHAAFYATKYNGCAPLYDSLFNTTIGQIDSAKWFWYYPQDTTNNTVVNGSAGIITHIFPYTSNVELKVYNQCGIDSFGPVNINVGFTAVTVNIGVSYSDQYACSPHTSNILYNAVGADKVDIWVYKLPGIPNANPDLTTFVPAGNYTYTFNGPGVYVVKVKGSNPCDSVTKYDTITMFVSPSASFTLIKDTFCVGDTVSPINTTNNASASYFWVNSGTGCTLPNPATSTTANPWVVFTNPCTDSLALGATISYPFYPSPGYCADTFKMQYTVVSTEKASFVVSNNKPSCLPATVTFTNNSPSGGPQPLVWYYDYLKNINLTGTGNVSTYTYTDTGTYTVVLNTMSTGKCLYTDTQKIVVTSPYAQVWGYDHGYICGATPVKFSVTNPSGVDSIFVWHFGDGTSATTPWNTPNVFHSYTSCNNYFPSVDMISKGGCKFTMNWNTGDTIKIDSVKAGFVFVINKNCGNTVINFTDVSSACSGLNANSWSWNFGDIGLPTNFSTLQNPSHTYIQSDKDTIQLQVTANSGCTNTVNVPITIKVNSLPQITNHVINPFNGVTGCTGQEITYTGAASSIDPIKDYVWTFGSAAPTVTGTTVTNTYATTGIYLDTFTVNTIYGCYAQFFGSVQVNQTPVIAIVQTSPPQICRGVPYAMSATTTDPGTTIFLWGPAGGLNNPNANIVCTDNNCSSVTVSPLSSTELYVQGLASDGCTGYSDTVRVDVIQPITLTITPPTATICIRDSVNLNAVAVGTTVYAWDVDSSIHYNGHFNDSVANPTVVPQHVGHNIYTLRVTNGCFRDSASVDIVVGGYPKISLGKEGLDTIFIQTGSTLPMSNYVTLSNDTFRTFVWTPNTSLNCSNCPDPVVTVGGSELYTLTATNIYGCSDTDVMYINTFCQNSQVFIPNAFTPDGDGKNDILMVRGSGIKLVKNFRIYNRWGQVVFERANFQVNDPQFGWDGKVRNTNSFSPPDVYVYYCEVVCDNDTPFTYKGNITLVK